jgi:hypothetical protein
MNKTARPPGHRYWRLAPEHGCEDWESVLGATPHEFESRILRHSPREPHRPRFRRSERS